MAVNETLRVLRTLHYDAAHYSLFLSAAIGIFASIYAVRHIAIDTNTATLISPDLPWRQPRAACLPAVPPAALSVRQAYL